LLGHGQYIRSSDEHISFIYEAICLTVVTNSRMYYNKAWGIGPAMVSSFR
jgi:hypothetical protein